METTLPNVVDGVPLGATLLAGAVVVLGRGSGQGGGTMLQDMAGGFVCRLHGGRECLCGGDPLGAPVLVGALVVDRSGGHDGETKLHFHFRVLAHN